MSKALKEAGWRLVLPEIRQIIKEELQASTGEIRGELKALNVKVDTSREEIISKIESLRNEMMSLRNELKADIGKVESSVKDLDKRLDIAQRLAIIEAQLKEYRKNTASNP